MYWQTSRFTIDLTSPKIMGIVNVTPDSFSDGGQYSTTMSALRHAEQLLADGADILDIGGESTRPGSPPVPEAEELARVLPVLKVAVGLNVPISVDTYKPTVMQAALDLGVDIINDVWALRQPGADHVVARHSSCGVCLMHMHRNPRTMQNVPMDGNVVEEVASFLQERVAHMIAMGLAPARLAVDPGIGFGKTVRQNFALLARQERLLRIERPLVAGWSRKSSLGVVTDIKDPSKRIQPSVVAALLAIDKGARIVRVHDVLETAEMLKVWSATRAEV